MARKPKYPDQWATRSEYLNYGINLALYYLENEAEGFDGDPEVIELFEGLTRKLEEHKE